MQHLEGDVKDLCEDPSKLDSTRLKYSAVYSIWSGSFSWVNRPSHPLHSVQKVGVLTLSGGTSTVEEAENLDVWLCSSASEPLVGVVLSGLPLFIIV